MNAESEMATSDGLGAQPSGRTKVSVFPLYGEKRGGLCSYFEHEVLEVAMREAGRGARLWLNAPGGLVDDPRPIRFTVDVELPGAVPKMGKGPEAAGAAEALPDPAICPKCGSEDVEPTNANDQADLGARCGNCGACFDTSSALTES